MTSPIVCLSAAEVAAETGLSISTVRKLTRQGIIPHITVGRRILYPVTALHNWMLEQTFGSTAPDKGGDYDG
ncbi:helix-turn-helix domain-containing protein [Ruminococcus sp.]|jgi:excisionase family DNA binding protein|uniref:helix-turn-helix domain-containing protein n=1 Tax=Ruminococcus sp. TaxID=41978 RepID=UPI0025F42C3C|nr:helix-turn-helix domain-containing protein [Ruminococcus sp.]